MVTSDVMRRAAWVLAATAGVMAGGTWPPALHAPFTPLFDRLQPATFKIQAAPLPSSAAAGAERVLWDFTTAKSVSEWRESSDGTARAAGMSTGAFKLQKTARFQRAVMFSLINPQPNGAGFVGFSVDGHWDLSGYRAIQLRARAQGEGYRYKVYLKHHGDDTPGGGDYESYFEMPQDRNFTTISVPLDSFQFYYRGRLDPSAPPLDPTDVTRFGIQIYGGVYADHKQRGVSALEIDSISVTK